MTQDDTADVPHDSDLGRIDRALLDKLSSSPQASNRELAESLNLPLLTVAARVRSLHARNAVQIRPVLSLNKAGRVFVFCKLAINAENVDDVLREVAMYPEFVTVASILGGKYNALVYFTYGDMSELHQIISNIIMKIDGLSEMETSIISDSLLFKPEYIKYPGLFYQPDVEGNANILRKETARCGLDELDISIISELQCNERKSVRAIARDYGVNPGTVQYRLRYMESNDIIRFVAVVAHQEMLLNCFLFLEMRVEPGSSAAIAESLSGKPWLSHLHEVIGPADLNAFVATRDLKEGQQVISMIRGLPGVKAVGVEMLMETFKLDPRWGFVASKA